MQLISKLKQFFFRAQPAIPPLLSNESGGQNRWSDFPFKGRPHWRRILQVFEVLELAAPDSTYTELVNYVKATTGTGCSRKLVSKWKKERQRHFARTPSSSATAATGSVGTPQKDSSVEEGSTSEESDPLPPRAGGEVPRGTLGEKATSASSAVFSLGASSIISSDCQSPSLRVSPSPRQAWSYLAATAIVVGVVGFDWLHPQSQSGDNTIQVAVAQEATSPSSPVPPKPKARRSEPRNIKISLTLSSRQDLKVKQGDKVVEGQVLSDRTTERSRLLARKKQLELSLEKLNLPLPPIQ